MKKVYKIIISSLMVTSFTMQYTAYSGAGAGAGGDSASSSSSSDYFEPGAGAGAGGGSASSSSSSASGMQGFNQEATENLLTACYKSNIKDALQAIFDGANVNQCYSNGSTPLSEACENNNLELVKLLLDNGAQFSIDEYSDNGNTALSWACYYANSDIVKLLLNHSPIESINKVDVYQRTPLSYACEKSSLEIVKLLLEATNEEGQPALDLSIPANINVLHSAINEGKLKIVEAIIGSKSFYRIRTFLLDEILNSLQTKLEDEDFVQHAGEDLFNEHYPALLGGQRDEMIRILQASRGGEYVV